MTAKDFNVTGDLSVVDVRVAENSKTATLTFNKAMTDGAEYTLQLIDENDKVTSSVDFKYQLGDVADIALTKSTFEKGENIKEFLKVFDENGVEISTADYNVVEVESSNTDVVKNTGEVDKTGTSNIRVEVEYKDGSKTKSDFIRVDVEKAETAELAGFELDASSATFDNTEDYRLRSNSSTQTSFYEKDIGETSGKAYLFVYADDSKENPEIAELDLSKNGDYTVTSKNPEIISVSDPDSTGVELTAVSKGKANIQIEGPSNYKKTVTVEVKEDIKYNDLALDATSIKLSDETKSKNDELGVNQELVTLDWLDQYGDDHAFTDYTTNVEKQAADEWVIEGVREDGDKLVVSASQTNGAFKISNVDANGIEVTAVEDKTVKNASIRVSYYEDKDANKATTQKVISTTVVDVNGSDDIYDYETYLDTPAIDASNPLLKDTATLTVYGVDEDGDRLALLPATDVELTATESISKDENEWFNIGNEGTATIATNEVTFEPDADKFLANSGELKLYYTVKGSNDPHGTVTVSYDNSFKAPAKATVNTSPVLIHAKDGFDDGNEEVEVTVEELLFGKINEDQLVIDDEGSTPAGTKPSIAVKKGQDGYFNKAILNLLDNENKAVVSGTQLYGLDVDVTAGATTGNGYLVDSTGLYDDDTEFEVTYSITNAKNLSQDAAGTLGNTLTIDSGDEASFTIVISEVTVAAASTSGDYADQVQKNNLLDAPKAVNVILNQ